MKSTDDHKHGSRKGESRVHSTLKSPWKMLLIALPATGLLLMAIPVGLGLWTENFGPEFSTLYRYRLQRPTPGSVTLDLEREIAFYQERIRQDPETGLNRAFLSQAYLKMARATGETSWYLLAEQTAQQSLAKLPFENDGAILALARVATARHDFAQAIRLAKQVQEKEDALPVLVTAYLAIGQVKEASQAANALVDRVPSLGSLTLRALVRVAQGQDQAAMQDFQRAIAAEEAGETGSSAWARTLLGRLYFKRGQLQPARGLYQEALHILPQYPPARLNLAELEVRLGNYQAAERYYSEFPLTSQRSPAVYDHIIMRGMARVKDLQGNLSGAREWQDKAEARLHEDLTGFGHKRELARLLLERGHPQDLTEALSLMQAEVQTRRDAETLDTLAAVQARLGHWREAQQAMREALRWNIRDAGMFDRAGTIEQALGNSSQARSFFQLAQETDPTFDQQAQRALGLGVGLLGLN